MEPKEIKYNPNIIKPETVEFFKVVSNKLDNGKVGSICFHDVLFCEVRKDISDCLEGFYVLNYKGFLKTGVIRNIDKNGNFLLESQTEDKKLFPDYTYNFGDCSKIYRVLSLSRDVYNELPEPLENWDDYDEVKIYEPKTMEDLISQQSVIADYINKDYPKQIY